MNTPIAVAITGASGVAYGLRLLEVLLAQGQSVDVMISKAGQMVLKMEAGLELSGSPAGIQQTLCEHFACDSAKLRVFGKEDWLAPVASGSNPARAMVVCPCTSGTLAAIAAGLSSNLIERAADVTLKEQRKLILVVRETPFSATHLENMLKLSRMGAVIMPANPGFYHQPQSIADLVDFMVARVLDHLDVQHDLSERWGAHS